MSLSSDHRRFASCIAVDSLLAILAVTLMLSAGCGSDGPERAIVSGSVTFEGEPLEGGTIRFSPTGQTQTPSTGGYISDGRYEIATKGGVLVGTYIVQIEGFRTGAGRSANEGGGLFGVGSKGAASKQFLPVKYNRQSELRVEIIADRNAETHDFALTNSK